MNKNNSKITFSGKVGLYTLGCKLNFAETSTIGKQFTEKGYSIVDFNEIADVYVINTCTVTQTANKECRQIIRKAKKRNPKSIVIVTGCYAQLKPEEIISINGVDLVIGSKEKFNIFTYFNEENPKPAENIFVSELGDLNDFGVATSTDADDRTRAFLKIQDGCSYKCAYCTIPLARGKSRSLDFEKAIEQFAELLRADYKEIILTGVNVGDYNAGESGSLYNLLCELIKFDGDYRLRISSIEPNLLSDNIVSLVQSTNKLCNHFHIPLQSGSEKVLQLMRRRYSAKDFRKLIFKLNDKIKDVCIGVDVIVGFPGETEDDFLETYSLLRELPISYLHVFTYSERENTDAMKMDGKVETAERKRRTKMLRILSEKKKNEFYERMRGADAVVLFEKSNHKGFVKGFSSNYIRVKANADQKLVNKLVHVKLNTFSNNEYFCSL